MSLPLNILDLISAEGDVLDLSPVYSPFVREFDKRHWSPLGVIIEAVRFLTENSCGEILDIGSGSGKFCLIASLLRPDWKFHGVEQREYLVKEADRVSKVLNRENILFYHKNFTQLDLGRYSGFYFYNSFFENMPGADRLDENIEYSPALYQYYSLYLQKQLEEMPAGTRIATYCSLGHEIPPDYRLVGSRMENKLKLWTKI